MAYRIRPHWMVAYAADPEAAAGPGGLSGLSGPPAGPGAAASRGAGRAGAGNRQPGGGLVPSRYARAHGVAFLHPEPASERVSSRPGLHSLLRADVRDRDHPGDPDHAAPLEGGGRRPGPGRGRGPVGRPGGHRRRPDLLRPDHPEVHPAPLVRGARGLGRRAGHLGRDRPGRGGRVLAGAPLRGQRDAVHERGRPGAARGAGRRPGGQLLQPGTLRRPDHAALGPAHRARVPARPATRSSRPSIRPSCTSSSSTCSGRPPWSGWATTATSSRRACSRCTSRATRRSASSRSRSGWTRPSTSSACG